MRENRVLLYKKRLNIKFRVQIKFIGNLDEIFGILH